MLTTMATQIAVIGSGQEWEPAAEEVGRLLAERGCTVVTGGLSEVMEAAHRGAKAAGGATLAIVPGERRSDANQWADHVVVTGIGHARNLAVAASGDAVIAVAAATERSARSRSHFASADVWSRSPARPSSRARRRPTLPPRRSSARYETSSRRPSR
jgi:hypothetical protein